MMERNIRSRPEEQFHFRIFYIPDYMRESLLSYVDDHIPAGNFLTAVLENSLSRAISCADDSNMRNIPAYGNFLYNYAPSACWGSPEKVAAWLENEKT